MTKPIPSSTQKQVKALLLSALTILEICSRQINGENNPILANNIDFSLQKKYPYKKPRLVNHKNDLTKRWYIEFGQWSFEKNKIIRRRWYKGFEGIESLEKRYEYGVRKVRELQKLLPYSFIGVDPEITPELKKETKAESNSNKIESIEKLIDTIVDELYINKKGYNNYSSIARKWVNYTEKIITITTLQSFKKKDAQIYIDYMESVEKLSAVTIRNRISVLKAIFNKAIERDYINFNPFEKVKLPKKIITAKNKAYNPSEIKLIKSKASSYQWLICQFIYYTYIRPIEITRLKVDDVFINESKIRIKGIDSKNSKTNFIAIPGPLLIQLRQYLENDYPNNFFLFSKFETPADTPLSKNHLARKYKELTNALNLDKDLTLYSWKHTGVVNAYKNGVDIKALQLQCRHHSIVQTDTYLKSLGFMENEEFLKGIPEI